MGCTSGCLNGVSQSVSINALVRQNYAPYVYRTGWLVAIDGCTLDYICLYTVYAYSSHSLAMLAMQGPKADWVDGMGILELMCMLWCMPWHQWLQAKRWTYGMIASRPAWGIDILSASYPPWPTGGYLSSLACNN